MFQKFYGSQFSKSKEQRFEEVYVSHQPMQDLESSSLPGIDGSSFTFNFSSNQSRSRLKMFAPLAPDIHEPGLMTDVQELITAGGLSPLRQACMRTLPFSWSAGPCIKSSTGAQLTIFYKGQVNVYNNVSSAKAKDILLMAAANGFLPPHAEPPWEKLALAASSLVNTENQEMLFMEQMGESLVGTPVSALQKDQTDGTILVTNSDFSEQEPSVPQALPQARRASLSRFLKRRRERLMSRSPYWNLSFD